MKKRNLIFATVILIALVALITSPMLAKYIREEDRDVGVNAEKFYFTIDLLGDTVVDTQLSKTFDLYGGDDKELSFKVQNYFDDYRITESNVSYTVSYEVILPTGSTYDENKVTLNDTGNQSLTGNTKSDKVYTLNIEDGYDNLTQIKVTVKSTTPYVKEMILTFVLNTFSSEFSYYIIDSVNSLYAELIITSNIKIDVEQLVIDFNEVNSTSAALQIDTSNTYLLDVIDGSLVLETNKIPDGQTYLKSVTNTVAINAGEAVSFKFFKSDITKNYSLSNTQGNGVSSVYTVTIPNV